jgi:hypothetical protein
MNDLDLNKTDLLEAAKALQAAVAEASQYNAKQLDVSECQRAALQQFMREQDGIIQEMKYRFNQQVLQLRQDFCKQPGPLSESAGPSDPDPKPLDSPSCQE